MKVALLGSRLIQDTYTIKKLLKESKVKVKEIVTNGNGLGFYAQIFGRQNKIPINLIPVDYSNLMKRKIDYKYKEMIEASDMAFIIKDRRYKAYQIVDFINEAKHKKNYKVIIKEIKYNG